MNTPVNECVSDLNGSELGNQNIPDVRETTKTFKKPRWVIWGAALLIITAGIIAIIKLRQSAFSGSRQVAYTQPSITPISLADEGELVIKNGQTINFQSGTSLALENNQLYYSLQPNDLPGKRIIFKQGISTFVNGYLHTIKKINCITEVKFFDDYSAPVITSCKMSSNQIQEAKPTLTPYHIVNMTFGSVTNESIPRYANLKQDPWIAVSVPYFQLAKMDNKPIVNVVSPQENVVSIYTYYGRSDFQYDTDELTTNKEKTENLGPLSITIVPQKLTCAPPYVNSDGSCYTLEYKGSKTVTHNVVDFSSTIVQKESSQDYPLLLGLEN